MKTKNTERNPLSPRNDYFFKRIFGDERDKDILTDFLKAALDIPADEYGEIEIVNPISNVERAEDKYSVLDVKVRTKSGKVINVEIQRYSEKTFRERIVYQVSKLIEEQIDLGDDYDRIHAAICMVITEFTLITENNEYHNRYVYRDERTGSTFSDVASIHVFELSKLPEPGTDEEEPVLDWLRFIDSDEVKNMEAIAEKNEGVGKAVRKYKELTASAQERMIAEAIAKQRRIEKGRMDYALERGFEKGHEKGREEGREKGREEGREEGLEKGRKEGEAKGRAEGIAERNSEIARRLEALGMGEAEIAEVLGGERA